MRTLKRPKSAETLFDLEAVAWWSTQLSPNALRVLRSGWQGLFQRVILGLLEEAAEALGSHFDEELGRPSKELYALSGLLLIAEFKDWTIDQAAEAWTLDAGVQFALHLPRDRQYLCPRTLDNYRRLLRENGEVESIFQKVTGKLVEELELDIRRQRLDSTHILSQMAVFTRHQLLAVGVRRFLADLKKWLPSQYEQVSPELRERYAPKESRLFGFGTRQPQPREQVLQQAAEDLATLVTQFAAEASIVARRSYAALARLFQEHCEVREGRTVVRPQSIDAHGGSTQGLQNPSDPDAGYSGHKGSGYQVQLAQTLPPRDVDGKREGPGLVTACVPQSAAVPDSQGLGQVLAQQQPVGLQPHELLGDTSYGGDANVQACVALGIRVFSPVNGTAPAPGPRDFSDCGPVRRALKERLEVRRQEQATSEWKNVYRFRSGIEGLHHALDVVTGMKKLRVRGARAVAIAVTFKVTGWNILTAAKIQASRARRRPQGSPGARRCAAKNRVHARHSARPRPARARHFSTSQSRRLCRLQKNRRPE